MGFFTIPQPKEGIDMYGNYLGELHIHCKSTEAEAISDEVFDLPLHYTQVSDRLAVAFDAFNIKEQKKRYGERKSQIFEAVYQLRKFIAYSVEQRMNEGAYQFKRFSFYFPCIVFDGRMFEAFIDEDELKVREASHFILQTQYRTPFSVYDRCLLVDIVHKDHFKELLKFIRKDANIIKKKITKKKRKINQKLSEIEDVLTLQRT